MKKTMVVFLLLLLVPSSLIVALAANHQARIEEATFSGFLPKQARPKVSQLKMCVTAYYLPLRHQKNYLTGSYKGDIRLNGRGITASGKPVRIGHVSASKHLPLGTTLYVPGYGYAVVEDRGGAIKGQRLDIFVGRGDAGLKKAIAWGKKKLYVTIYKKPKTA